VNDVDYGVEHASSEDDQTSTKQTNLMITEDQVTEDCKSDSSDDYTNTENKFNEEDEIREYAK
jgi:hypothetical protein